MKIMDNIAKDLRSRITCFATVAFFFCTEESLGFTTTTGIWTSKHRYATTRGRPLLLSSVSKSSILELQEKEGNSTAPLGAWIPVGSASCLKELSPSKVEIMGQNFVVWCNGVTNNWSVTMDACPHHLYPLSQGRINPESGCLECGYHGWQFDTNGAVARIPQMDDESASKKKVKGVASFPVHVTGDLIWVFLPTSFHGESFPKSLLPEEYYPGLQRDGKRSYSSYEFPASMHMLIENGLDPSHFPFAHHGYIARREDAAPLSDMKVSTSNFTHYNVFTTYTRKGIQRERLYGFQRPALLYTQERSNRNDDWKPGSLFFVVPVREGRSRIVTSVDKLSKPWMPDWITHLLISRLSEGDFFLHEAEMYRQKDGLKYQEPTQSDTASRGWNRWMNQYGFADSSRPPHTFGRASNDNLISLPMSEIRSPWLHHTSQCSKCRRVLKQARRVQLISLLGGILVGGWQQKAARPIWSAVTLVGGIMASLLAKKVVTLLEGSSHPSDIQDRSNAMFID